MAANHNVKSWGIEPHLFTGLHPRPQGTEFYADVIKTPIEKFKEKYMTTVDIVIDKSASTLR